MRISYFAFTTVLICSFAFSANAQSEPDKPEHATLTRLNSQVMISFRHGDFDRAIDPAVRAVELSTKLFGRRNVNTAICLYNYAEVLAGMKKLDESITILKELVDIYAEIFPDDLARVSRISDRLATIMAIDGRYEAAESYFLQNIERSEKKFGVGKVETLPLIHALTRFYVYNDRNGKADASFLREYEILWSNKRVQYDGREALDNERICFKTLKLDKGERKDSEKRFDEAYRRIMASDQKDEMPISNGNLAGGDVNGRAISLPRPLYPASARSMKITGPAVVKVLIHENGQVMQADMICGNRVFAASVVLAAVSSKFSPTLIGGKPVKVSGVITYMFRD